MNAKIKTAIKRILPGWVLHLYWLFRVIQIKVFKWVPRYDEDELITAHRCDFVNDDRFKQAYDAAVSQGLAISDTIRWRAHVACWAATRGVSLDGDFVECGVNKGFLSKIVTQYVGFESLNKQFWLLDTFEGFADEYLMPAEKQKHHEVGNIYGSCYDVVYRTFGHMKNVKIVKGTVPDTLPEVSSSRIAYLSIDMNCVYPEIAAAEFFWPKLVSGATILLDDYGHAGHELQKDAFDQFSAKHHVPILVLPTGQGLIIKP